MPSRGALLTGRHPVRNGLNEQVYLIDELEQRVLSPDEKLFPEYMKELGYTSACFGKWNLGFAPGHRPTERGFDEDLGNISGNGDYLTHVYQGRSRWELFDLETDVGETANLAAREPVPALPPETPLENLQAMVEVATRSLWRHRPSPPGAADEHSM